LFIIALCIIHFQSEYIEIILPAASVVNFLVFQMHSHCYMIFSQIFIHFSNRTLNVLLNQRICILHSKAFRDCILRIWNRISRRANIRRQRYSRWRQRYITLYSYPAKVAITLASCDKWEVLSKFVLHLCGLQTFHAHQTSILTLIKGEINFGTRTAIRLITYKKKIMSLVKRI